MTDLISASTLEHYLHAHIPLSRAMQVSVRAVREETVVLAAPLAPNINHRETVFGGSASAVAMLAAWSLLHVRLLRESMTPRLVIQRHTMSYERPIAGDFTARASLASQEWAQFMRTLARRGKARICLGAILEHSGQTVATFAGEFVALSAQLRL